MIPAMRETCISFATLLAVVLAAPYPRALGNFERSLSGQLDTPNDRFVGPLYRQVVIEFQNRSIFLVKRFNLTTENTMKDGKLRCATDGLTTKSSGSCISMYLSINHNRPVDFPPCLFVPGADCRIANDRSLLVAFFFF